MEESQKKKNIIDLREVASKIWHNKKLFFKVWVVTFVLASAWVLPIPRNYLAQVTLAPELEGNSAAGALGSIASSFGVNVDFSQGSGDAIQPLLYPHLFESTEFICSLFDIKVESEDGDIKTTYYDYMRNYQKKTFYKIPLIWTISKIKKLFGKKKVQGGGGDGRIDPFRLSEDDQDLVEAIKGNIVCTVDKQFYTITILVRAQDRLICATMADSVRVHLQDFITEYRTQKARVDVDYYKHLIVKARKDYEAALIHYSTFCDAHRNTTMQVYLSKRDDLENELQLKYNAYNALSTQLQTAEAKVQERTPAFTILQNATVPIKASEPKRMLFVLGMLVMATTGTILYVLKDNLFKAFF